VAAVKPGGSLAVVEAGGLAVVKAVGSICKGSL